MSALLKIGKINSARNIQEASDLGSKIYVSSDTPTVKEFPLNIVTPTRIQCEKIHLIHPGRSGIFGGAGVSSLAPQRPATFVKRKASGLRITAGWKLMQIKTGSQAFGA